MESRPSSGDTAWLVLAAGVVAYDAWASTSHQDTLSRAFGRALDDPRRRWPTLVFWVYLTGHLWRVLPDRFDPLRRWA